MATLKTTIRTPSVVRTIVRGMGRPGESAAAEPIPANTAPGNFTEATALPTAQTKSAWVTWLFSAIYAQTTDPGIEGQPWNDNGLLRFSAPNLSFSLPINSMYIALIIEEF